MVGDRHQPVAAELDHCREEAERLNAGDPAHDELADLVREISGDIAVDRLALRLHRAPFEPRNLLADLLELLRVRRRETALAELVGADQRAVDEQVGVAPDRRGEVRVGAERQAEMAEPLGRIARLHLRAQELLHDLRPGIGLADALDDPVEGRGLDHLPERELDPERLRDSP